MRVAHFIQRYPPALGGSEAYCARLSRFLQQSGDQVSVFTSNALSLDAFWSWIGETVPAGMTEDDGVRVFRYALLRFPGRRFLLKALAIFPGRLWRCLTMPCNPIALGMWRHAGRYPFQFDVVHAAAFPYAWPIACGRRLARRLNIPFVLTPFLHLGDPDDPADPTRRGYTSTPLRWLLHEADLLFAQTDSERQAMMNLGIAPEKVVLQGLGVDPSECTGGDRDGTRAGWKIQPGEVVIGHLANNSREKGTVDLLLAVEQLWQRGLPVRVVLAGPDMPNFRAFWGEFSERLPADRVLRLGVLSDQGKRDFFAGLDLFALPSRSDSFGLVLLEAWANGLANVGYRAGGIADVIRHESDGLLVRCGDINSLADALERLVRDEPLRRHLGRAGQERLPGEFSWNDKLRLVRERYESLTSRKR